MRSLVVLVVLLLAVPVWAQPLGLMAAGCEDERRTLDLLSGHLRESEMSLVRKLTRLEKEWAAEKAKVAALEAEVQKLKQSAAQPTPKSPEGP